LIALLQICVKPIPESVAAIAVIGSLIIICLAYLLMQH